MIENPAVQFTLDAKAGEYDEVSDETYNFLLNEVEELSKFWCDQKEVPAVQVLGAIFQKDESGSEDHRSCGRTSG